MVANTDANRIPCPMCTMPLHKEDGIMCHVSRDDALKCVDICRTAAALYGSWREAVKSISDELDGERFAF